MNAKLCFVLAVIAISVRGQEEAKNCNDRCSSKFQDQAGLINACQRGCRLYQFSTFSPLLASLPFFDKEDQSLITCKTDCDSAYESEPSYVEGCKNGCDYRKEEGEDENLFTVGNDGFSISIGSLPGMGDISGMFDRLHNDFKEQSQELRKKLDVFGDQVQERVEETSGQVVDMFHNDSFFSQVHRNFKNLMENFMKPWGNDLPGEHGGGELTVIKSGPGYHSEKTYKIGPNADLEQILKSTNMDDMIQHENPMEKSMDQNDIEIFKPMFHEFSEDIEGPRLPETGLRSRPFQLGFEKPFEPEPKDFDMKKLMIVEKNRICSRDSGSLSWSDWLSCLHIRMGLPNWLLAASVAMGVLFTLWICLMIPSNAPKQRIRKQANINTKEIDASGVVVTIAETKKMALDLPPSYDDVTKDQKLVLEPVHGKSKIILDDDDEITEPLPEERNQSVV